VINWLRRRLSKAPNQLVRRYELRYLDTGEVHATFDAPNACAFDLELYARGVMVQLKPAPPQPPGAPPPAPSKQRFFGTFVAATGERVSVIAEIAKGRARIDDDMPWFDRQGRLCT
jgi:hypothetical protein